MNALTLIGAALGGLAVYAALVLLAARFVFGDRLRLSSAFAAVVIGYLLGLPVAAIGRASGVAQVVPFVTVALSFAVQCGVIGYLARFQDGKRVGIERAFAYVGTVFLVGLVAAVVYLATTVPIQALMGQLLIGLINGAFYALLSLGLAVIFGLLNIINFTHGAQYMLGAMCAFLLLTKLEIGYWWALLLAPVVVGFIGILIERLMLSRLYKLDHLYGLLLTFGLALIIQGALTHEYGTSGTPYPVPAELAGGVNLGFMFLPIYRGWVVAVSLVACFGTWFIIEKTKLGSYLRAATENAALVQAFGINVPRMITLTYGFGVALAAFAGVMAAPIYQVNPLMGANLIIVVFAVVVIGGMGSIMGSIVTGYVLGIIEGLTKVFYPEASATVIFVIMVIVLMIRPAGLFGSR